MPLRSKKLLTRPDGAMYRTLFKCMGYKDHNLDKPIIAIANSWSTVCPGHFNLRKVSDYVKKGIEESGGTAVEFGTIGACDGLAQMHEGMRYILPSRELIANDIESMVKAHPIDAVVMLGSCDKIVPGMLMAAARLDIPSILVNGGPMMSKRFAKWNAFGGDKMDVSSVFEAGELVRAGKMSEKVFLELENAAVGGVGSCQFLGTANSMCCFAEALGMALPGTSTIPAEQKERLQVGRLAGKCIMNLLKNSITAKKIITKKSIENAVAVMMAIGGSTNIVLHSLAIAHEADVNFTLEDIARLSYKIPQLTAIIPSSKYDMADFHDAGGVPAVMKQLGNHIYDNHITVSGKTVAQNISQAKIENPDVIKNIDSPIAQTGGLVVLYGNIAPDGAVTKKAAIPENMLFFEGPARVFDSEAEAVEGIRSGSVHPRNVVVIRYEGPKGGPGMPEMWAPLKILAGAGLAQKVAVITDGRFSGSNSGLAVGYISPEAQEGGPLAALKDTDHIIIDIRNKKLSADIPSERLSSITVKPIRQYRGYLGLYSKVVSSAAKGAVID